MADEHVDVGEVPGEAEEELPAEPEKEEEAPAEEEESDTEEEETPAEEEVPPAEPAAEPEAVASDRPGVLGIGVSEEAGGTEHVG